MRYVKVILFALFCTSCSKLMEYDVMDGPQNFQWGGTWVLADRLIPQLRTAQLVFHLDETLGNSFVQLTIPDIQSQSLKTVDVPIEWEYIPNYGVRQGKMRCALKLSSNGSDEYLYIKNFSNNSVTMLLENEAGSGEATLVKSDDFKAPTEFPEVLKSVLEETLSKATNEHSNKNWMGKMPDGVRLCNMLLPGSHDSATYGIVRPLQFVAQCQKMDIFSQWNAGIRFFDFRIRENEKGEIALYHNFIPCNISLKEAVDQIIQCVKANPTETVIVSSSTEYNQLEESLGESAKILVPLFNSFTSVGLDFSYSDTDEMRTMPKQKSQLEKQLLEAGVNCPFETDITLGEARGKVLVITQNKLGTGYGYGGYIRRWEWGWPLYGETTYSSFYGQDYLDVDNSQDKEQYIKENWYNFIDLLEESEEQNTANSTSWFKLSASGYIKDISYIFPNYPEYDHEMVPKVIDALKSHYGKGIVMIDFVGCDNVSRAQASTNLSLMVSSLIVPPFFGLRQMALEAMLQIATRLSPSYNVRGAELTNLVVEKNFTKKDGVQ